jgi:ankyrin repeat protein
MTTNYIQFKAKGICTRKEDFSEDVEDFMIACAKGDNKRVEQGLVNMNPDVIDNDGYTPLMLAVWGGHFKIVKNLVDAGAAIDTCDNKGNTALMLSAWRGDFEISKYLVNNGASLTIRNWRDSTALIFAAAHGRPKVFSMLLEREEVISFDDTVTLLTYTIYKRFESEAALYHTLH